MLWEKYSLGFPPNSLLTLLLALPMLPAFRCWNAPESSAIFSLCTDALGAVSKCHGFKYAVYTNDFHAVSSALTFPSKCRFICSIFTSISNSCLMFILCELNLVIVLQTTPFSFPNFSKNHRVTQVKNFRPILTTLFLSHPISITSNLLLTPTLNASMLCTVSPSTPSHPWVL